MHVKSFVNGELSIAKLAIEAGEIVRARPRLLRIFSLSSMRALGGNRTTMVSAYTAQWLARRHCQEDERPSAHQSHLGLEFLDRVRDG